MSRWWILCVVLPTACNKAASGRPEVGQTSDTPAAVAQSEPVSARTALALADQGIAEFWSWWSGLSLDDRLRTATGEAPAVQAALSKRVDAIYPQLAWEFAAGSTSEHSLALSGEGDPVGRLVAERWKRAGPTGDAHWTYFATRQPIPAAELLDVTLEYEGVELDMKSVSVRATEDQVRPRLSISVWHPNLAHLPGESRTAAAFVALDNALGEHDVEMWLGKIEVVTTQPNPSINLVELRETVAALAAKTPPESFATATGTDPETGASLVFILQTSLRRWDNPFHDTFCDVRLGYTPDDRGMPTSAELAELQDMQETLLAELDAAVVFAGAATGGGARHLWLFADGDTDALQRIEAWAKKQPRTTSVESEFDPGWNLRPI